MRVEGVFNVAGDYKDHNSCQWKGCCSLRCNVRTKIKQLRSRTKVWCILLCAILLFKNDCVICYVSCLCATVLVVLGLERKWWSGSQGKQCIFMKNQCHCRPEETICIFLAGWTFGITLRYYAIQYFTNIEHRSCIRVASAQNLSFVPSILALLLSIRGSKKLCLFPDE